MAVGALTKPVLENGSNFSTGLVTVTFFTEVQAHPLLKLINLVFGTGHRNESVPLIGANPDHHYPLAITALEVVPVGAEDVVANGLTINIVNHGFGDIAQISKGGESHIG